MAKGRPEGGGGGAALGAIVRAIREENTNHPDMGVNKPSRVRRGVR